jgi:hypothetical protein
MVEENALNMSRRKAAILMKGANVILINNLR